MLTLPGALLRETFEQFRACGGGKRECVAYWLAAAAAPDVLTGVIHPVHTANLGGYQVDSDWVTGLFLQLRRSKETVRVQVHTHPREAGHSWIDDGFSLVSSPGFLSLVIPDFAFGDIGLDGAHLVEMTPAGEWFELRAAEVFSGA